MIDRACISLNNNCNLKCKYCHFADKQKDYNSFKFDELKVIIDNIHDYCKTNSINKFKLGIVGSGEPMLKSSLILELLDFVNNNNYNELNMYTVTNGTLLSKDLLKKFLPYKDLLKICVSLDGYNEIHNLGREEYSKVIEGINNYKEVFGGLPSINATVNVESFNNKESLIEYFQSNKMYDVTFSKLVGYYDNDLYISDEEFKEFMEYAEAKGMESRQFRKDKCYDCTMYGNLCGVGRTNIFITPEGIYPCGRFYKNDKYLLGKSEDNLFKIEEKVNQMLPVEDGKCFYIENVEVIK